MDQIPPQSIVTPIPPVSPVVPSPTPKTPFFPILFVVLILVLLVTTGTIAYQNMQLQRQIASLQSQPTPTPSVANPPLAETPSADPSADWKTYTNKKFGYEFKYPNNWLLTEPCEENCRGPIPLSVKSPLFVHPDGQIVVEIQDSTCGELASWSWSKSVNKTTISIDGQSGLLISGKLDFNDNQLHDVKNICIPFGGQGYHFSMWSLNNPEDVRIFDQILSTFKFIGISVTPTPTPTPTTSKLPKYTYTVPSGWPSAQDQKKHLQVNYNPKNEKTNPQDPFGVTIYRLVPATGGYPSNFFVDLLSYSGSDQHQFIYKSMGATPQKGDLMSGYKETNFYLNDWQCLSLDGISISQYHTIWGMCDIGSQKAIFYTSGTNDYITYLKTVSIL